MQLLSAIYKGFFTKFFTGAAVQRCMTNKIQITDILLHAIQKVTEKSFNIFDITIYEVHFRICA